MVVEQGALWVDIHGVLVGPHRTTTTTGSSRPLPGPFERQPLADFRDTVFKASIAAAAFFVAALLLALPHGDLQLPVPAVAEQPLDGLDGFQTSVRLPKTEKFSLMSKLESLYAESEFVKIR